MGVGVAVGVGVTECVTVGFTTGAVVPAHPESTNASGITRAIIARVLTTLCSPRHRNHGFQ